MPKSVTRCLPQLIKAMGFGPSSQVTFQAARAKFKRAQELFKSGEQALQEGKDTKAWDYLTQSLRNLYFIENVTENRFMRNGSERKFPALKKKTEEEIDRCVPLFVCHQMKLASILLRKFNPAEYGHRKFDQIVHDSLDDFALRSKLNNTLNQIFEPVLEVRENQVEVKTQLLGIAMLCQEKAGKLVIDLDKLSLFGSPGSIQANKSPNSFNLPVSREIDEFIYPSEEFLEWLTSLNIDHNSFLTSFNRQPIDSFLAAKGDAKAYLGENLSQEDFEGVSRAVKKITSGRALVTQPPTVAPPVQTPVTVALTATPTGLPLLEQLNPKEERPQLGPLTDDDIKKARQVIGDFLQGLASSDNTKDSSVLCRDLIETLGERSKGLLRKIGISTEALTLAIRCLQIQARETIPTLGDDIKGGRRDALLQELDILNRLCGWNGNDPKERIFYTDITNGNVNKTDEIVLNAYAQVLHKNPSLSYEEAQRELFKALDHSFGQEEIGHRLYKLKITDYTHQVFIAYLQAKSEDPSSDTLGEQVRAKLNGKVDLTRVVNMDDYLGVLSLNYPEVMTFSPQPIGEIKAVSDGPKIVSIQYPAVVVNYFKLAQILRLDVNPRKLPDKGPVRAGYESKYNQLSNIPEYAQAFAMFVTGGIDRQKIVLTVTLEDGSQGTREIYKSQLKDYLKDHPIRFQ